MKKSIEKRFWEKVNIRGKEECWEWIGGKSSSGYGNFGVDNVSSHRMSWMLTNGEIPDKLFVCHKCDNRACVNPNHLFLGTSRDNINDMVSKGRSLSKEKNPKSKLTTGDVLFIRNSKLSQPEIAKIFNITSSNVSQIVLNKTWKGIE